MRVTTRLKNKLSFLMHDSFVPDGRSYYVMVPEKNELSMPWDTRKAARQYKNFLKENSRMELNPEIREVVFEDGYQISERKIS